MGTGGPKTAAGKAAVAVNAVKHGLLAAAPIAAATEQRQDWETHLSGTVQTLGAEGHVEIVLAERIAVLLWRLGRVARYEAETIQLRQETAEAENANRRRSAASSLAQAGDIWPEDARGSLGDARRLIRLLRRLPDLADDHRLSGSSAVGLIYAVAGQTDLDPDAMQFPGVSEGELLERVAAWTVGRVRQCIAFLADQADQPAHELLAATRDHARRDETAARYRLQAIEQEVMTLRRERLLPDGMTLDKIARYEAHLNRQLVSTLHELEAMQSRRQGRPAPLARLDVTGLPDG